MSPGVQEAQIRNPIAIYNICKWPAAATRRESRRTARTRKVASSSNKTRITTDSLSPGVQTGGSNSQSARYLEHFAWPGKLTFAIRSLFTALGVARGGAVSQSAHYFQHVAWPGRLKFAIRSLFTALGVAREAQIRNPLVIYSSWRSQNQLTDANHDV